MDRMEYDYTGQLQNAQNAGEAQRLAEQAALLQQREADAIKAMRGNEQSLVNHIQYRNANPAMGGISDMLMPSDQERINQIQQAGKHAWEYGTQYEDTLDKIGALNSGLFKPSATGLPQTNPAQSQNTGISAGSSQVVQQQKGLDAVQPTQPTPTPEPSSTTPQYQYAADYYAANPDKMDIYMNLRKVEDQRGRGVSVNAPGLSGSAHYKNATPEDQNRLAQTLRTIQANKMREAEALGNYEHDTGKKGRISHAGPDINGNFIITEDDGTDGYLKGIQAAAMGDTRKAMNQSIDDTARYVQNARAQGRDIMMSDSPEQLNMLPDIAANRLGNSYNLQNQMKGLADTWSNQGFEEAGALINGLPNAVDQYRVAQGLAPVIWNAQATAAGKTADANRELKKVLLQSKLRDPLNGMDDNDKQVSGLIYQSLMNPETSKQGFAMLYDPKTPPRARDYILRILNNKSRTPTPEDYAQAQQFATQ